MVLSAGVSRPAVANRLPSSNSSKSFLIAMGGRHAVPILAVLASREAWEMTRSVVQR
jgi:hypothetical protein